MELILRRYNLNFVTYELTPGVYTVKGNIDYVDETLKGGIQIQYDGFTMKTKLLEISNILRFDDKLFFSTLLGFTLNWDYKPNYEYISQKVKNSGTLGKLHLNCDVFHGSVINGSRQPILFCFVSDRPPCCKVFYELETIH